MSESVKNMFSDISGKYDLTNDVLSLGVHRLWRSKLLSLAEVSDSDKVLDLCCGTGDLAFAAQKAVGETGTVVATDFVPEMIVLAKQKAASVSPSPTFSVGDAMKPMKGHPEIAENSFDAVTIGFGIRNVDDPLECSKQVLKVLKPGGTFAVLEFGQPKLVGFSSLYRWYSDNIMPKIGGLLTGNEAAYRYLPETSKEFLSGEDFLGMLLEAGFVDTKDHPLLTGLAHCYIAKKPS